MKSLVAELDMCNVLINEQNHQAERIAQDQQKLNHCQLLQKKRKQRLQLQQMAARSSVQENRDECGIPAVGAVNGMK